MKIDQFMMLPMQSVALAATTFVGQNHGARREDRVKKGTRTALGLSMVISIAVMIPILSFAPVMVKLFNSHSEVVRYGSLFLRLLRPFYVLCCVNQILASTLRGLGDSKAPILSEEDWKAYEYVDMPECWYIKKRNRSFMVRVICFSFCFLKSPLL